MNKALPLALFIIALAAGAGSLYLVVPESERTSRSASPTPRLVAASASASALLPVPTTSISVFSASPLPLRFTPVPPFTTLQPTSSPILKEVKISVFEDLLCEPCARQFNENLLPFLRTVNHQAVIRFYALPTKGDQSELLAKAAFCADQAGQGLAFRQSLYGASRKDLAAARLIVSDLGIPPESFDACLQSDSTQTHLADSALTAQQRGIVAVPTTLIDTEKLEGIQPIENLRHFYKKAVAQNQ